MTTAAAGTMGFAPQVKIEEAKNPHKEIYERAFETDEYAIYSPGEELVRKFWETAEPLKTQSLIDWGSGCGRASLKFKQRGLSVKMVDFVENARDKEVIEAEDEDLEFILADLSKPLEDFPTSHFGFCADVMEHLPEESVDIALNNILSHSKNVFFQIHCLEDHFGHHPHIKGDSEEKVHLHLTVKPYSWWLQKFADHGVVVHSSEDNNSHCIFYVTAFRGIYFDPKLGTLNVDEEELKENIRAAAKLGLPQIGPFEVQEEEVMLLAGGPSLNDFEDEIIQNRMDGMKLVTVNNTYNWAMDRGLKPSMQVIIDAREFNERFTHQTELSEDTKFLVCSAAHPSIFENLPKDRTYLFHTALEENTLKIIEESFGKAYESVFPVPGGCTVTLRALAALRMLGFYKFHIYGFDSCILNDRHHAYEQNENDEDLNRAVEISIASGTKQEKKFLMAPWHAYQCLDWRNMAPRILHDCLIDIKGDGAIAHMTRAAAALSDGEEIRIEETPGSVVYALRPIEEVAGLRKDAQFEPLSGSDIEVA